MPPLRSVKDRERKNKRRREPPMIVNGKKVRLLNEMMGRRAQEARAGNAPPMPKKAK